MWELQKSVVSSHACNLGCCRQVSGKRTELYSCRLLVAAPSFSVFLVFTVGSFKPHDLQMHPIIISSARAGALGYDALDSRESPTSRSSSRVGGVGRLFDARMLPYGTFIIAPRETSTCILETPGLTKKNHCKGDSGSISSASMDPETRARA
jgi:hypothetical protein